MHKTHFARHLAVATACLALVVPAMPAAALDGTDSQPPQLVAFDLAPQHVDVSRASELVTVRMHVTDASGVEFAGVSFHYVGWDPPDGYVLNGFFMEPELVSGTVQDGVWVGSFRMPRSSEYPPGQYRAEVRLIDRHYNDSDGEPTGSPNVLTVTADDARAPDAPSEVVASAGTDPWQNNPQWGVGPGAAVVSWTPGSDNYSPVTSSTVTASPGGQACTTTHNECTVTGLTDGAAYTFTVTATNAIGTSPSSRPSNPAVPAAVPPAAPLRVEAYAGEGLALVQWDSAWGNGLPVTYYTVRSSPGGLTATVPADVNGVRQVYMTGLTAGTAYTFTVTGSNEAGEGPPSPPSNHVLPVGVSTWTPTEQISARTIDGSCPDGQGPDRAFDDVQDGSAHQRAIDCVAWWDVAQGRTPATFAPTAGVTRAAMATFIARSIEAAQPGSLPQQPRSAFDDDDMSVHQRAIDQLAAVGVVSGTGGGKYTPDAVVNRGQMARFLAAAAEHVIGEPLPANQDLFNDDTTSPFQADINRVAAAGLTSGRPDGTYDATGAVQREQMGSFLARSLDLYVANGSGLTASATTLTHMTNR